MRLKKKEMILTPKKFFVQNLIDRNIFNFNTFKSSLKFASNIYNGKDTLEEAKKDLYEMFK